MAYATTSSAPLFPALSNWAETLRARRAAYRTYRTTYNELKHLSDRELADIGIHRSMIRSIAKEAAQAR